MAVAADCPGSLHHETRVAGAGAPAQTPHTSGASTAGRPRARGRPLRFRSDDLKALRTAAVALALLCVPAALAQDDEPSLQRVLAAVGYLSSSVPEHQTKA